jgi:DNA replication protein DnaC
MSTTPNTPPAKAANAQAHAEVDGLRERLLQLGLAHAAEALAEELSEAVKHDRPAHAVLGRLLARETGARDERRVKVSLKLSNLPPGMTLGNFDFGFQPSIERRQVETLATCAFIREHCTLLVQGPPGVGKTHLVVALGVRAIEQGFSVAFYRLEELLHEMRKDAAVPPQALRRKKYFNVSYLVVDEVGFEPMSHQDASLFFRLVSYRYRRGSTAITTNKSVKDWPGILAGDEAMAAAILDRLLHKSVVLNVRGRSYRLQELEKVLK